MTIPYFTPLERKVAQLLAEGRSDKQIAQDLGISLAETTSEINRVYKKSNTDPEGIGAYVEHYLAP